MQWLTKNWNDLSKQELYAILKFRMEIFILEQQSFYLDLDDQDQQAIHFLGKQQDLLIAYARISMDHSLKLASIRRVAIHKDFRKNKLGSMLMEKILDFISPGFTLELDAQYHLQAFYQKFGFRVDGEPYDDGGVLHIRMVSC